MIAFDIIYGDFIHHTDQFRSKIELGLDGEDKIVGGSIAGRTEFPYIISLRSVDTNRRTGEATYSHICGGSIIGHDKILTAAHCTFDSAVSSFTVAAGQFNTNSDSDDHEQIRSLSSV